MTPRSERERIPAAAQQEAGGEFIRGFAKWRLWVTITFRSPIHPALALETHREWLRALAKAESAHVACAYVVDQHRSGAPHIHALLGELTETLDLDPDHVRDILHRVAPFVGFERIRQYDDQRRASHYIAQKADWEVFVACPRYLPCRRKRGCLVAPKARP